MGIVNVTPDSFFEGGRFPSAHAAVHHAMLLLEEGADIIDVGGESTRPGARVAPGGGSTATVSAEEELRRVLPVIEGIRSRMPEALISIDTYKATVARAAVAAGAEIINDISALRWDTEMPKAAADLHCGVVLTHMRGRPEEWKSLPSLDGGVVALVCRELGEWASTAESAGIAHNRIVIDPGYGFGKILDDNYPLLARLGELQRLGFPILAGTSRKSFVGRTVSRTEDPVPVEQRLHGTMATVAASILMGAHIVRVHDVAAARETAVVCDEILRAGSEHA
jgi:dihydropteroate synthase